MYEAFKLDDKQVIQERWGKSHSFFVKNSKWVSDWTKLAAKTQKKFVRHHFCSRLNSKEA